MGDYSFSEAVWKSDMFTISRQNKSHHYGTGTVLVDVICAQIKVDVKIALTHMLKC